MEDTTHSSQPPDIRDALRPVRARLWLIIVCVAVATALTYYHYNSQPKLYTASTRLFIGSTDPTTLMNVTASDRETTDLAGMVTTPAVYQLAAKELRASGHQLSGLGSVSATAVGGSDFVNLTSVSGSAWGAAAVVNAVADAFVANQTGTIHQQAAKAIAKAEQTLSVLPNSAADSAQRTQLQAQIQSMLNVQSLPTAGISHIDPAFPPSAPVSPNPTQDAIFAFVITLMLTIAGAYGLDRLDRRIRKLGEIERVYGYPVLAAIPRTRRPAPSSDGMAVLPDELREAFRTLRMNLELAALDRRPKTLIVASAIPREGKSTIARNLALACREAGLQVCVVDADVRRPDAGELFNVSNVPGLTDVVVGDETLAAAMKQAAAGIPGQRTLARLRTASQEGLEADDSRPSQAAQAENQEDVGSLVILPSGTEPANPPVVLGSDRMRSILGILSEAFDIVIIDTSPLLAVSDALPLLSIADGVLVVSRLGLTTRDAATDLVEQLRRIPGANLFGIVANDVHGGEAIAKSYYSHGYANTRAIA